MIGAFCVGCGVGIMVCTVVAWSGMKSQIRKNGFAQFGDSKCRIVGHIEVKGEGPWTKEKV